MEGLPTNPSNLPQGWDVVPIYLVSSNDARKFGRNQENRKIDPKHAAKIKKDWNKSKDFIPPITVNFKTNHIIDGQHRLQAFIELVDEHKLAESAQILVRFIDVDESEEKQLIIDANTKSKNWNQNDYIESHSETNEQYKKLNQWCIEHSLCNVEGKPKPRYGAAMILGKTCGAILKNGKFNPSDDDWNNADEIHNDLVQILEILEREAKGSFIEPLAIEWIDNKSRYSFKQWLSMLRKEKAAVNKMPYSNRKDWRAIFDFLCGKIERKQTKNKEIEVQ